MPSVCDDPYDPRGVVRDTLDHIRVPPCSPSTSKPPAHTWSRIHDQRLGALRALTAFESSAASPRPSDESDAMHWVERGVLSLPMPSFDDDTREDYRCYVHVHASSVDMQAADVTAAANSRPAFHLRLYHHADPQDNQ
ncbi:hypothetical protein B0H13DRAFT_2360183 [Mycena leptocephala]|nr:hypothetical protein B0H13DRAFT_2360183 [Mycena leptocephala]